MSVLPAVKDEDRVCRMEDNSLRIKNVREDDAGTYSCQATISGRAIKKNLPISVVVNGKSWSHMSLWAVWLIDTFQWAVTAKYDIHFIEAQGYGPPKGWSGSGCEIINSLFIYNFNSFLQEQ